MLVIRFLIVTFIVAWPWCSSGPSPRRWSLGPRGASPAIGGRAWPRVLVTQALEELDAAAVGNAAGESRRRESIARSGLSVRRPSRPSASSSAACRAARPCTICSVMRRRFSTRRIRRLIAIAHSSPIVSASTPGRRGPCAAGFPDRSGCPCGRCRPRRDRGPRIPSRWPSASLGSSRNSPGEVVADLAELLVDDRKVVDQPLAAGVIDRSSLIARARTRYDSSRTRPFSATRGRRRVPTRRIGDGLGGGEVCACCSSRSTLNSSARIGSSSSACDLAAGDGVRQARSGWIDLIVRFRRAPAMRGTQRECGASMARMLQSAGWRLRIELNAGRAGYPRPRV